MLAVDALKDPKNISQYFACSAEIFELLDEFGVGCWCLDDLFAGGLDFVQRTSFSLCLDDVQDEVAVLLLGREQGFHFKNTKRREVTWGAAI